MVLGRDRGFAVGDPCFSAMVGCLEPYGIIYGTLRGILETFRFYA